MQGHIQIGRSAKPIVYNGSHPLRFRPRRATSRDKFGTLDRHRSDRGIPRRIIESLTAADRTLSPGGTGIKTLDQDQGELTGAAFCEVRCVRSVA
jgi:hypothetical protein